MAGKLVNDSYYNKTSESVSFTADGQVSSYSRTISNRRGSRTVTRNFDTRTARQKQLANYNEQKAYKQMISERRAEVVGRGVGALKLVIAFPLLVMLISILQGTPRIPTFTGLLEGLSNFDVIPTIPFLELSSINLGNWDIVIWHSFEFLGINFPSFMIPLNWLRDIVSYGFNIVNVLLFLINGLVSVINLVIFFVRWIFL